MRERIAVVGGGVAGLTLAYELAALAGGARDVVCLEASGRPGGTIATDLAQGWLCEWGPNGFLDGAPATRDLVRRLGLEDRLVGSDPAAATRYLFRRGTLHPLFRGPVSLARSRLLSAREKARLLVEGLVPALRSAGDESVHDFAARRMGAGAADTLADAMATGIFAGDARRLSVQAAFPRLPAMERSHGSLTRALLARRRPPRGEAGPGGGRLASFRTGMHELTDALANALGPALRLGARVTRVDEAGAGSRFRLELAGAPALEAGSVVLACPAWSAADLVVALDPEMARAMAGIPSAPVAVVHLGFDAADLARAPRGFGFLVPGHEDLRLLGTLWASSIFAGRAPPGGVLWTCMLGGARRPEVVDLDDHALSGAVLDDLKTVCGVMASPRFVRIVRHPRGIPQYTLGHLERVGTIDTRLQAHPGLFVSGNSYRGVSANACIGEAAAVAPRVVAALGEAR